MSFLVVRLEGDTENVVVPDFWTTEDFCLYPSTRNVEKKVKSREMFKNTWPNLKITRKISAHCKLKN